MPQLWLVVCVGLAVAGDAAAVEVDPAPAEAQTASSAAVPVTVPAETVASMVADFENKRMARALKTAQSIRTRAATGSRAAETARLVEAIALLKLKRIKEAQPALQRIAEHGPALGSYLDYLQAGVAASLKQCAPAQKMSEGLPEGSTFVALAWARLVTCWLRVEDAEAAEFAAARLEAVATSDTRRAFALLQRARIAEASGDTREARDLYRAVLVSYPLTSAGRSANTRLSELKQAGLRIKPLAPEEVLPRAQSERSMLRPRRARRTYQSVIRQSRGARQADLRHAAELGLVELDIVDRRYQRALGRLARVLAENPSDDLAAQTLYLQGDILSRKGRLTASLAAYEKALTDHPTSAFAIEAALEAARLAYGAERDTQARRLATWLLEAQTASAAVKTIGGDGAQQAGDGSRGARDQALWLLAWIERRAGSPAAVMDSFLARIDADGPLAEAALYWRARLALDAGQPADAEVFANLLAKRNPTSFYTMAAADRLGRASIACDVDLGVPRVADDEAARQAIPAAPPQDLRGAVVLFQHGLQNEARTILRLLPPSTLSVADRTAAAWLYRGCGDVYRAALLTRSVVPGADDPVLLSLAFPRPFTQEVHAAALQYDVPPDLIWAVIRQESAFNPRAVSPRKARGLMQMIRPTATRMAREAKLRRFRQSHLYDPAISIRLGTHYIASLLRQFDGNLPAAIASYHAGENAVARWLKTRKNLDADEFIESIPYTTTRGYVKKVLSSYGVYRLLYRAEPAEAIPLRVARFGQLAPRGHAALR